MCPDFLGGAVGQLALVSGIENMDPKLVAKVDLSFRPARASQPRTRN